MPWEDEKTFKSRLLMYCYNILDKFVLIDKTLVYNIK